MDTSFPQPYLPPPQPYLPAAQQILPPELVPQRSAAFVPSRPQSRVRVSVPDSGFVHFLRFLLVSLLMQIACVFVVGILWVMISLSSTGRRKRDILMLLIPIWGSVVQIQTFWRYSAKNVYWSVRQDRPSKSLVAR